VKARALVCRKMPLGMRIFGSNRSLNKQKATF